MNGSLVSEKSSASVIAVTVAVRGTSSISAISPKPSPRRSALHVVTVLGHLQFAGGDGVEAVAGLALADHRRAGCHVDRFEGASQALELGRRQRREDGNEAQQLDLHLRHVRGAVDAAQAPPDDCDDDKEQHGRADERRGSAAEADQGGHEDGPEGEADTHQRLEQGEHLAEHVGRRRRAAAGCAR